MKSGNFEGMRRKITRGLLLTLGAAAHGVDAQNITDYNLSKTPEAVKNGVVKTEQNTENIFNFRENANKVISGIEKKIEELGGLKLLNLKSNVDSKRRWLNEQGDVDTTAQEQYNEALKTCEDYKNSLYLLLSKEDQEALKQAKKDLEKYEKYIASFDDFRGQFPKASLPYSFDQADLKTELQIRATNGNPTNKPKRLDYKVYDFLPTLEEDTRANSMPVYPEPVASFETQDHYAVVYNTGRSFAKQYKTYNLAVFKKDGEFVASHIIAGVNPTNLASATIDENLQVTITEYSVNWVNDYGTNGISGNTIDKLELISTRTINAIEPSSEEGNGDWKNVIGSVSNKANQTSDKK